MNTENLSDRRRQTRSRLVEAGISVFAVKGIAGASIEEICEAGGLTRGAFYSNFSSRDDLVLAAIEIRTTATLDRLDETIQRWTDRLGSSVVTDIETVLTQFIRETFDEKQLTVAGIIAEHEIELYCLRSPDLYSRYREFDDSRFDRLAALVSTALDIVGARSILPLESLLTVLISIYTKLSFESVAGKPLTAPIHLDPTLIVDVLLQLLTFDRTEAGPTVTGATG